MKFYNQNNYGHVPYPSPSLPGATVKSGGCGVVSSANVLAFMGLYYPPDVLAKMFIQRGARVNGGTDMTKAAQIICELAGCTVKTTADEDVLAAHLQAGGIAIANVDGDEGTKGIFSSAGHFINLVGWDGDDVIAFDVGYYKGKFSSAYRAGYVTVETDADSNTVQRTSMAALGIDTAGRNPAYWLFTKGDEDVDFEKLTDKEVDALLARITKRQKGLNADSYAKEACQKAVKSGLFSDGDNDKTLDNPQGFVKRQELAVVLDRDGRIG